MAYSPHRPVLRWIDYIKERFPPLFYLPLALGMALSGELAAKGPLSYSATLFGLIGIAIYLLALQMAVESKELKGDRLANPRRPLPRKLFSPEEFERAINRLQIALFPFAGIIWLLFSREAALLYLLLAIYLWHFRRDFSMGELLSERPLTRAFTLQITALPLALFPVSLTAEEKIFDLIPLSYATMMMSAFSLCYLSSGLNPSAHPITKRPIHYHGFRKLFYAAAALLLLSAAGAATLGLKALLFPVELSLLLALSLLFFDSSKYRFVEAVASLSLLIHSWALVLYQLMR